MEENQTVPSLPPSSGQSVNEPAAAASEKKSNAPMIILGIVAAIIVIGLIVGAVALIRSDNATTGRVRDLFIIFMALESIVIGAALVVLIIQLATLINLLRNEVRPIISATNDTVNTLRGTVTFISDNLTQPVIQLNAYLAGIKQFFDLLRPGRSKR